MSNTDGNPPARQTHGSDWGAFEAELKAIDPLAAAELARLVELGSGHALEPVDRELLRLALSVSPTHLWRPAVQTHVRGALDHGATAEQVTETLLLVSVLGMHSLTDGIPVLCEAMRERGEPLDAQVLDPEQEALRAELMDGGEYWERFEAQMPSFLDGLLRVSPEAFRAFFLLSALPWRTTTVSPLVKELMYVAIDVSTTHLYEPGLRFHIDNALKLGATSEHLVEVFLLAAEQGAHSLSLGLQLLSEAVQEGDAPEA
jgi:alkylhydroperoxidase/carboxymuconolactone decarboxylase family protein YurZ